MSATNNRMKVTDEQLLDYFHSANDAFVTTRELVDEFEMTRQAINGRLESLAEEGRLTSKQCGSGYGWWLSDI